VDLQTAPVQCSFVVKGVGPGRGPGGSRPVKSSEDVLRYIFLSAVLMAGIPVTAVAQDISASNPLELTVRPSGVDGLSDEARQRQERLAQRMRRNDFLFRSICVHCSNVPDRSGTTAPFEPLQALSPSRPG